MNQKMHRCISVGLNAAERGKNMKFTNLMRTILIAWFGLLVTPTLLAAADLENNKEQTAYSVQSLGTLGGTQSAAYGVNNRGWVTGAANLKGDQTEHPVLWRDGLVIDLGTLGGPNGSAGFPLKNEVGIIPVFAQTPESDQLQEEWNYSCTVSGALCQGTDLLTRGYLWIDGFKILMPTFGGNKGQAWGANNHGQVVGVAETANQDPSCVAPQVVDYEAVMWDPGENRIKELPLYPGDSVGAAVGINDIGQAVGATGYCAPISPAIGVHAVLWQNGEVIDLGSLGGVMSNVGYAINNRGQVAGVSDLAGDSTGHAFFWQNGKLTDLGTLPGDFFSVAFSINNKAQVVGQSCDVNFNCRAFLWQNGVMSDLNTLIPANSPLDLIVANDLNDAGEIVGQAFDQSTGGAPAFLAIPCDQEHAGAADCKDQAAGRADAQGLSEHLRVILPEGVREQLRQRRGFGRFAAGQTKPQSSQPEDGVTE